jgi:hypothetical protein
MSHDRHAILGQASLKSHGAMAKIAILHVSIQSKAGQGIPFGRIV